MSIASMADQRLAKQSNANSSGAITPLPGGSALARWIPSEAIAIYVAFYAGIFGSTVSASTDFTSRWRFLFAGEVGTAVLVVLVYTVKWRGAVKDGSGQPTWELPTGEMFLAALAFSAWALALPASPANDWHLYGDWFPVAILLAGTAIVPLIAGALGIDASGFDDASSLAPSGGVPAGGQPVDDERVRTLAYYLAREDPSRDPTANWALAQRLLTPS